VIYRIRVRGHLDMSWQSWFAPLHICHESGGTTLLWGSLPDQSALYGVLLKLDRLGLTLLSLQGTDAVHDAAVGPTDGSLKPRR
jgi:hypothetical protein